ncbi:MAG: urea carboxylase-associated family protein [Arenicellales bacterium]|jgi:hypothetical protein|nr:urea carboxylase-associated family protein [Arenicellales bacterium]|tara:strand:+ start:5558 stop:6163 length:606 start_codon:yes stop_codon:yes gene_type:complete
MDPLIIPASEGRAVKVSDGASLRIITPKGAQAADFFAYNAEVISEWLSPMHTWVLNRSIKPREGHELISRFRRPMLTFEKDGASGVHDMMLAACDQFRYEQYGHQGPHPSCSENLQTAMRREGYEIDVVPQPINFFTNTFIDADANLTSPPNPVPPGAYVELRAHMNLICVISSCPFDLAIPDWQINSESGVSELIVELIQ